MPLTPDQRKALDEWRQRFAEIGRQRDAEQHSGPSPDMTPFGAYAEDHPDLLERMQDFPEYDPTSAPQWGDMKGLMPDMELLEFLVDSAPPAKDGGTSIRNPQHPHFDRVCALREKMAEVMKGRSPFVGVALRLDLRVYRATCRADALNLINGLTDVLQKRCGWAEYQHDVWVFDDDANIREFHYTEVASDRDCYQVTLRPIQ